MKQIRITESELKNIISESVIKVLNEGSIWYNDGDYEYQGIGTPESEKRVKRIQQKHTPFNYDGMIRSKKYNGDFGTDKSVYSILRELGSNLVDVYEEAINKIEKTNLVALKERLKKMQENSRYLVYNLEREGFLKRDFYGEPSPKYKGE